MILKEPSKYRKRIMDDVIERHLNTLRAAAVHWFFKETKTECGFVSQSCTQVHGHYRTYCGDHQNPLYKELKSTV